MSGKDLQRAITRLNEAGIDINDARLEVSAFDAKAETEEDLESMVDRRLRGEPAAYIVGERSFYKDIFAVTEGVLIPRSDTELLVESALMYAGALDMPIGDVALIPSTFNNTGSIRLADICTGTGCVGISVAKELESRGLETETVLTDISDRALYCSADNSAKLLNGKNIRVIKADLTDPDSASLVGEDETFDLLLSNPPYINAKDMDELDPQVKDHEPRLALFGGDDGLDLYPHLASLGQRLLKKGGALIVEHGYDQGEAVRGIFEAVGYTGVLTLKDYGGNDRVTYGRK